jgi:hypothetical protein
MEPDQGIEIIPEKIVQLNEKALSDESSMNLYEAV